MSHNHNLSLNSLNSIIEPTTPPTAPGRGIWDPSNQNNLSLPNFNLEVAPRYSFGLNGMYPPTPGKLEGVAGAPTPGPGPVAGSLGSSGSVSGPVSGTSLMGSVSALNGANAPGAVANAPGGTLANAPGGALAKPAGPVAVANESLANISAPVDYDKENIRKIDKEYLASISKVPLAQIKPEILKLSKDQYGCRFLQKKIDENLVPNLAVRRANFETIFKEIYPHLYELIIDPFGNYLIQKLIGYCNELNLNLIMEILQYNLLQISINQHGTRALQRIIDNLNNSYQLSLLTNGLRPYIIELIKDLNGNHVIQKILNKYLPQECQFIYDSIIKDLLIVATHKHGCCVLQKCLNHVTAQQLQEFSDAILSFDAVVTLINDQFGNYVLQYLISINSLEVNLRMFGNFIRYGINDLCNLKFSSNVIEKFLKNCVSNEQWSRQFSDLKFDMIYQILVGDLNKLINDPYGNYVIQTLIDVLVNNNVPAEEPFSSSLLKLLPANYKSLSDSLQVTIIKHWFQNCKIVLSFGKRIQLKINIILNGLPPQYQQNNYNYKRSRSLMAQQNMTANGEFISTDAQHQAQQASGYPQHSRSMSYPNGNMRNYQMNYYQPSNVLPNVANVQNVPSNASGGASMAAGGVPTIAGGAPPLAGGVPGGAGAHAPVETVANGRYNVMHQPRNAGTINEFTSNDPLTALHLQGYRNKFDTRSGKDILANQMYQVNQPKVASRQGFGLTPNQGSIPLHPQQQNYQNQWSVPRDNHFQI